MNNATKQQIIDVLVNLGISSGDGLLVHSALQFLGLPEGGTGMYLEALQTVLGSEGSIVVPTFNFAFANGQDYDPQAAPAVGMGTFSEHVRQYPEALRTTHPMQSLAVVGLRAEELSQLDTPSAFDDGSAFDRMIKLDFKLLLLGVDIEASPLTHYSEQRAQVPYRYWKDFSGRIKRENDWETLTYTMFVRDMEIDPRQTNFPIQEMLESRSQWATQPVNYGYISVCNMRDFVSATDDILANDVWALVTNQPESHYVRKTG